MKFCRTIVFCCDKGDQLKILVDACIVSKGGGVQVSLSLIKNIIMDSAFEVILVVSPQIDVQLTNDIKNQISHYYVEVNESIFGKKNQGKRLALIEKEHQPDLVFVVFGPSYWRSKAPCLQGFALPLMVYEETRNFIYKDNLKKLFYEKILNFYKAYIFKKNSDYAVVETETFKNKLSDFMEFDKSKIYVVENSFNTNFIQNEIVSSNFDGPLKIFIPSAFYPHKNLEILINVAVILKENYKFDFQFNFLIPQDSNDWNKLLHMAQVENVTEHFQTYGSVPNIQMKSLYSKNNLILLPTLAEASTAVYPESFISQRVLLTSDMDFARELCGNAAIYFNPHDENDIATKIIGIASDENYRQLLIEKGLSQLDKIYLSPEKKWFKQREMLIDIFRNIK